MEYFASTTNPSTISSAIPLALVPSVSLPLPSIAKSLINSLKITIIMHQTMLLTIQACISSPLICPWTYLLFYSRPCVSTGCHWLLFHTVLATWNRVCWLLSQVNDFFPSLILVVLWSPDFFFFEDIPFAILQRLADVDYRKFLITDKMLWEFSGSSNVFVFGIPATAQTLSRTVFKCIRDEHFDKLVPAAFLSVCFKYYYPQWIYSHVARLSKD